MDDKVDVIARGKRIKAIMDDPDFQAVITDTEAALINEWKYCDDKERRDQIWNEINALVALMGRLQGCVVVGKQKQQQRE